MEERSGEVKAAETGCDPTLRADALRNRESILASARAAFAEHGLDASLDDIARCAGVGVATLYRRFPTREDSVAACLAGRMGDYLSAVTEGLANPDAWEGFCGFVRRVCAMQAEDAGFAELLTRSFPTGRAIQAQRAEAFTGLEELVGRAQAQGMLRSDLVAQDIPLLLMANAGVVAATQGASRAWLRFVALMIDGFRTERPGPLPEPLSALQMERAMLRATRSRRV